MAKLAENQESAESTIFDCHISVANLQYTDSEGQTIIHVAAREWNTDLVYFLMHYGAAIDVPDKYGRTPLFVAAAVNYTEMVQWLLDHDGEALPIFGGSVFAIGAFR